MTVGFCFGFFIYVQRENNVSQEYVERKFNIDKYHDGQQINLGKSDDLRDDTSGNEPTSSEPINCAYKV